MSLDPNVRVDGLTNPSHSDLTQPIQPASATVVLTQEAFNKMLTTITQLQEDNKSLAEGVKSLRGMAQELEAHQKDFALAINTVRRLEEENQQLKYVATGCAALAVGCLAWTVAPAVATFIAAKATVIKVATATAVLL